MADAFVTTLSGVTMLSLGCWREAHMPARETRDEKLDLRLTAPAKRRLQIAAQVAGRSVSEFVLESAHRYSSFSFAFTTTVFTNG